MAYVDLNPIRAAMADTPEASHFTSIQERIQHPDAIELAPFSDHTTDARAIPCRMIDYLQLVDWAGRAIDPRKRGNIPPDTPPILHRLGLDAHELLRYMAGKPKHIATALGSVSRLRSFAQSMGRQFIMGISLGRRLCPE
jgi:hypothetical protein